jgi:predicted metal-dependent phosphoesterase TrpH
MKPAELIAQAISVGLHGIAVTDHDTMAGVFEAQKTAPSSFEIIPGEEITTDRGEVIGLFLTEEIPPGPFDQVLFQIKSQNGLILVPHPFDPFRKAVLPTDQEAKRFDAIEVLNGRAMFTSINTKAQAYAQRNNCAMVCGSDAHYLFEVGAVTFAAFGSTDIRTAIITGGNIFGKRTGIYPLISRKIGKKIRKQWNELFAHE